MADHAVSSVTAEVAGPLVETKYTITRDAGYVDLYRQFWGNISRPLDLRGSPLKVPYSVLGNAVNVAAKLTNAASPTPPIYANGINREEFTQTACGTDLLNEEFNRDTGSGSYVDGAIPGNTWGYFLSDLSGTITDDWIWPAPDHIVIINIGGTDRVLPLCVEGMRSVYTLIGAQASHQRGANAVNYMANAGTLPAVIGADFPVAGLTETYHRLSASDSVGKHIYCDGTDFFHTLQLAYRGNTKTERSLVWGLPDVWADFYSTSAVSFGAPADKVLDYRLRYYDCFGNHLSDDEFLTVNVAAVECTPNGWIWNRAGKDFTFAGAAAIPALADWVRMERRVDGGSWGTGGIFMPFSPLHLPFAIGEPDRPHWVPGVMRQLA